MSRSRRDSVFPSDGIRGKLLLVNEIDREDFRNLLNEIGRTRMPFGKYGRAAVPPAGMPIYDLPIEYLGWFKERGFPKGRLGELLAIVYEVKCVGMDTVFDPLRHANGGRVKFKPKRKKEVRFDSGREPEK
ncbi:DUF3820 family protein [Luteolibacter luteus]|uniref:DUF3820 family protein n=1 Tax=Luteolibacter luteus TaxID=2728835 RepID=A0A858RPM0_9BACT|nr:DUF3820 family protein [Luteolibacter luteus]